MTKQELLKQEIKVALGDTQFRLKQIPQDIRQLQKEQEILMDYKWKLEKILDKFNEAAECEVKGESRP